MSSHFTLLSPEDEDNLHAKRLLNIEEKHFKRVQKRLLATTNPIHEYLRRNPVDSTNSNGSGEIISESEETDPGPANGSSTLPQTQDEKDAYLKSLDRFQTSTLHDFTSLSHSLARLQFLLSSNERERVRYAEQRNTITAQHASIREETSTLRTRLSEAREQLEVRKGYDLLAERVLWVDAKVGGTRAKTREELGREGDKLRAEIEELEREGDELNAQWADRRDTLQDVIGEAGRLRRVIRGEPEVVEEEKKDDEDVRSEVDGDEEQKRREDDDILNIERDRSNVGTPRPIDDEGASTPLPGTMDSGARTPLHMPTTQESAGMTPRSMTADADADADADVDADMAEGFEHSHTPHTIPEVKVDDAEKTDTNEMDTT